MSAPLPPLLLRGDCLTELARIPDASVDAVVTDPPYGIRFMGKAWDGSDISTKVAERRAGAPMPDNGRNGSTGGYRSAAAEAGKYNLSLESNRHFQEWCEAWARECLRILKPGGHLLASGSPRTRQRLSCGIEDAGFEIRDSIAWLYGSGFPKSMDVSKAIDKAAGAEREVLSEGKPVKRMIPGADQERTGSWIKDNGRAFTPTETAPATDAAREWEGWGTALKPAFEPIIVARKPFPGTVAANVIEYGTGALNIDATRIDVSDDAYARNHSGDRGHAGTRVEGRSTDIRAGGGAASSIGRWPANVVLDESLSSTGRHRRPGPRRKPRGRVARPGPKPPSPTARAGVTIASRPSTATSEVHRASSTSRRLRRASVRSRTASPTRRSSRSPSCAG